MQTSYADLLDIIKRQWLIIEDLMARVAFLEEELSKYKNRKNSNNIHLPPSKDDNRPLTNQSLPEKSAKSPAG